jgi:hypothetical protein
MTTRQQDNKELDYRLLAVIPTSRWLRDSRLKEAKSSEIQIWFGRKKSRNPMATENKILILGPTGAIGRHIVWASVKAGNPTYALVRNTPGNLDKPKLISAANPETKEELIANYQSLGVNLLEVSYNFQYQILLLIN